MYFKIKNKVNYYDCDQSDRLKVSAAMRYMQQSCSEHLEEIGIPNQTLREEGTVFVLIKGCIKIHRMPYAGETILIGTAPVGIKGPRFYREFRIDTESGELLLSCMTLWVVIDPETRKILRPSVFINTHDLPIFDSIIDGQVGDEPIPDLDKAVWEDAKSVEIRYSHIDVNGHVNNSHYADFACDCLDHFELLEKGTSSVIIRFQNEAKYGECLEMKRAQIGDCEYLVAGSHKGGPCFQAYISLNRK